MLKHILFIMISYLCMHYKILIKYLPGTKINAKGAFARRTQCYIIYNIFINNKMNYMVNYFCN